MTDRDERRMRMGMRDEDRRPGRQWGDEYASMDSDSRDRMGGRGRFEGRRYEDRDRMAGWGMPRGHEMSGYDRDHVARDAGGERGMSGREDERERDWYGMRTREEHYARQDMGGMYARDEDTRGAPRGGEMDRGRYGRYVIGNERGGTDAGVYGATHREYGREDNRGASRDERRGSAGYGNAGYGNADYGEAGYERRRYGSPDFPPVATGGMRGGPAGFGYGDTDRYGDVYGEPGYRDLRSGGASDTGRQGLPGMGATGQGRHYGRGPRNYQRSDDRIREEVGDALTEHGGIDASDIDVQVVDGEVTLSGSVSDRRQKRIAYDVAEDVRGVKDVHNTIRVRQEPAGSGESNEPQS